MKKIPLSAAGKVRRLLSLRGRYLTITLKFYINFAVYAGLRALLLLRYGNAGAVKRIRERRLMWTSFPFDLNNEALWNADIGAWLDPNGVLWAEGWAEEGDMPQEWFSIEDKNILMEVGAHVGYWTVPIAQQVGRDGLVIAVEPHPENYKKLLLHLGFNRVNNCIPIRAAAWNQTGPIWLEASDHSEQHHVGDKSVAGFSVHGITVDSLSSMLGLQRLDWIKMDVEGAECEVLEAARDTLSTFRPTLVMEIHGTWKRMFHLLKELNYDVVDQRGNPEVDWRGHILAKPAASS